MNEFEALEAPDKDEAIQTVKDAIEQAANGDIGAPFEENVIDTLRLIRDTDQAQYQRFRGQLKKAGVIITQLEVIVNQDKSTLRQEQSTADNLIKLVSRKLDLFHGKNREPFASFEVGGHMETWQVYSEGFKEWLAMTSHRELKKPPPELVTIFR